MIINYRLQSDLCPDHRKSDYVYPKYQGKDLFNPTLPLHKMPVKLSLSAIICLESISVAIK